MRAARSIRSDRFLHWLRDDDRWARVLLLFLFIVLVLTGTTTANITQEYLQPTVGGRAGVLFGTPQEIRWDEYLSGSPLYMSIMATHGLPSLSPLAEQAGLAMRYSEGGVFGSIVFLDGTILRLAGFLPEPLLFSLHWWLPTFLFLWALPIWFRQLGFSSRAGWLAGLIIATSPSVAWWSLQPVNIMGFTLAGCTLLLAGFRRVRNGQILRTVPFGVLSATLLASMPSAYLIWSLILGFPLLVVSVLRILLDRSTRVAVRWGYAGSVGAATLGLALGAFLDVSRGVSALSGTIYPGDRRTPSSPTPFEAMFGASASHAASNGEISPQWKALTGIGNHSELAMSWAISFVVLALLITRIWPHLTGRSWRGWLPVSLLLVWGLIWLSWSVLSFGDLSAGLPVFAQVPSLRAAQVVGIIGVLAICLAIPELQLSNCRIVVTAVVAGTVTLYASSLLQRLAVPDMSTLWVWAAGVGTALAVYIALRWPRSMWASAVVAALAFVQVAGAVAVSTGVGSYRDSAPAEYISAAAADARADGSVWASDFRAMDAMMLANGMPSLTGQQLSGPVRSEWLRLDPSGSAENAWNRGGSRIRATWRDAPGIDITSNGYNVITIDANPCSLRDAYPDLTTILSKQSLMQPCLHEVAMISWKDGAVHAYEFTGED
ncbi:hypothetical protein FM104_07005 [Microbacterium esteraromaticum]|uniref:Uncharacterized protein n=1 Tax=Microbacterium esteraromaticum TaxID=57043 RepID=A0A1R4JER4_9MICO|nr:hypothetical protein [Microbacterium esteraromaticum]SJN30508.1 hypothetical protein FM104_07005 [Microbacterium esteraromaticum]